MKYKILCVGKIKDGFYKNQINDLCLQISQKGDLIEIVELKDYKIPMNLKEKNVQSFLEKECDQMMKKISNKDFVIALCIEGKEISTNLHKDLIRKATEDGYENIVYMIGGSLGLPNSLKRRANIKFSFSKMTFPHQMMRMILCEEIKNICM